MRGYWGMIEELGSTLTRDWPEHGLECGDSAVRRRRKPQPLPGLRTRLR
jgi:hypothetical protein